MTKTDALAEFYEPFREFDELLDRIDCALRGTPLALRGLVVCIEDPAFSWVSTFAPHVITIKPVWNTNVGACLQFSQRGIDKTEGGVGKMLQVRSAHPEVSVLLTLDPTPFYVNTLLPLVRSLSPWVATPFLTSRMLVDLLMGIKGVPGISDLVITDFAEDVPRIVEG
jgi:hypothetical protein